MKAGAIEVLGTVRDFLPNAMVRVEIPNGHYVLAHASGETGRNFIRLLTGDHVHVKLSPFDPGRGRITRKAAT
jgi:translation initiation factor IF-1